MYFDCFWLCERVDCVCDQQRVCDGEWVFQCLEIMSGVSSQESIVSKSKYLASKTGNYNEIKFKLTIGMMITKDMSWFLCCHVSMKEKEV